MYRKGFRKRGEYKMKNIARALAFLIDGLLIFLPASMLLSIFLENTSIANFLPQLLFAVYNVVALTSFQGKTIGKYFAGLRVVGQQDGALYLGIREVFKLLYFIPIVGIILFVISSLFLLLGKKALHDYAGMSSVLTQSEYTKLYERSDSFESRLIR